MTHLAEQHLKDAHSLATAYTSDMSLDNRYRWLTYAERFWREVQKATAEERARTVAEMHTSGMSYEQIATSLKMSRARVQQLIRRGRGHGG